MSYPVGNPNFSGVKQPLFDELVSRHGRAAFLLEQLAGDLWQELVRLDIDTSSALRLRELASRVRSQATELQTRQSRVHAMQRQRSGAKLCTPGSIYWELPEAATPTPQPGQPPPTDPVELSIELWDANLLPRAGRQRPDGTPFSPQEDAVLSWMAAHRETILAEARKWNVSPQAIAAAIAWEAMKNVKGIPARSLAGSGIGRIVKQASFGPGKVHVDFPLVNQVEERGYLPRRSVTERESLLSSDEGSIRYIAAIMGAYSKVTEDKGRGHYNIRYDVPMLTQLYQGSDLEQWEKALEKRQRDNDWGKLRPENPMPKWAMHNREFLNAAVPLRPWETDPTPPAPIPPANPAPRPGPSPTPPRSVP
ncbi:hypothetical protein ACQEU8_01515 [Streptomyces sp. CA-250714]|uniref:hypothetical protein n=1 Tax=Streptomyces sp. CA-250714 TaxID=3240060 RepID=UPI003D8FF34A